MFVCFFLSFSLCIYFINLRSVGFFCNIITLSSLDHLFSVQLRSVFKMNFSYQLPIASMMVLLFLSGLSVVRSGIVFRSEESQKEAQKEAQKLRDTVLCPPGSCRAGGGRACRAAGGGRRQREGGASDECGGAPAATRVDAT